MIRATHTNSGNAIPIVPGGVEVFTFPSQWYFTASTASSTATLYITPGEGL